MQHTDWAARWSEGKIGFHQATVSPFLEKYADATWGSAPLGRVYVPLCGKSLDLDFLAGRADEVVGVDFVEEALREFFSERGLTPTVSHQPHRTYSAANYRLFAADVFDLDTADVGIVDALFDRAAMVALDEATRPRYAEHLTAMLRPGGKALVVTVDYDQALAGGPPFAVSGEEVHRLFDKSFEVHLVETVDALDERFRDRGLTQLDESVFAMTRR